MKIYNWIIALCGLWQAGDIVAVFVPGFGEIQTFVWNHIIVGIILMLVGAWAALTRNLDTAKTMNWIAGIAGTWLIVSALVLRGGSINAGLGNDILVGVIVSLLGAWAAVSLPRVPG